MRNTDHHEPELSIDPASESLIRRFELDWAAGQRPSVDEYVTETSPSGYALLVELAHIELELRIKGGEPARAADYLTRYPQLAADSTAATDLIAAEYEFRHRLDPNLTFAAFASRYPAYRERL
jgi:hypothetical protein